MYYNLGLAESKVPGRELRAIAWFGVYFSEDASAPNAAAVNEQMTELSARNKRTLERVISLVESEADWIFRTLGKRQGEDLSYHRDISVRDRKSGNLREAARLWAELGDRAAALKTAGKFRREEYKIAALTAIVRAQAGTGDLAGAHMTTELLDTDGSKSWAQLAIVDAYVKNGNLAAAQATAELIHDPVPKQSARDAIANRKPMVPGRYDSRDACNGLSHLDDGDRTHDAPLNSAPFLNLSGHLKSLSTSDDPQAVFDAFRDTADTLLKAHRCIISGMMKRPVVTYTYQGHQIVLSPDRVFDITGKVASAHVAQSLSKKFGIDLVLNDTEKQALQDFSAHNIDQEVGLISKGKIVNVGVVRETIRNGRLYIGEGTLTLEEAKKLASELSGQ